MWNRLLVLLKIRPRNAEFVMGEHIRVSAKAEALKQQRIALKQELYKLLGVQ